MISTQGCDKLPPAYTDLRGRCKGCGNVGNIMLSDETDLPYWHIIALFKPFQVVVIIMYLSIRILIKCDQLARIIRWDTVGPANKAILCRLIPGYIIFGGRILFHRTVMVEMLFK